MAYYRRNLSHWQPPDCTFFVTFRLAHSIPDRILRDLREDKVKSKIISGQSDNGQVHNEQRGDHFIKFDSWLDKCLEQSPRWLEQKEVAKIVIDEIMRLNNLWYKVISYCIMPNHVHILIDTSLYSGNATESVVSQGFRYPITECLRLIKGRSSRYSNHFLGRTGAFWHHESYDHVVRNDQELTRIIYYIQENPVKAGLVSSWKEWPYTYVVECP